MENASDAWHIPRYPTRKHCVTSMYGRKSTFVQQQNRWVEMITYRSCCFSTSVRSLGTTGAGMVLGNCRKLRSLHDSSKSSPMAPKLRTDWSNNCGKRSYIWSWKSNGEIDFCSIFFWSIFGNFLFRSMPYISLYHFRRADAHVHLLPPRDFKNSWSLSGFYLCHFNQSNLLLNECLVFSFELKVWDYLWLHYHRADTLPFL